MYLLAVAGMWASICTGCGRAADSVPSPAGTSSATAVPAPADRLIRVRLAKDAPDCEVAVEGPFELVDTATGERLAQAAASPRLPVEFGEYETRFPSLHLSSEAETIDLMPRSIEPVGLHANDQVRRANGWLRFIRNGDGTGTIINVLDIEDYLVAVVAAELTRQFHREMFRAQAIAARTYAWYHKQTAGIKRAWDVSATEGSQVYGDFDRVASVPQAAQAVHDTRGLVCTWDSPHGERIFCTYYSSVCGGLTQSASAIKRNSQIPPLAGDVRCDYCNDAPNFHWGPVSLSKAFMTRQLRDRYDLFAPIETINRFEVNDATPAGRPVSFLFSDAAHHKIELEAESFRLAVDPTGRQIRSTLFRWVDDGAEIIFEDGRGLGHGVGLCQYGAEKLARQGADASRILRFYYPTSRLRRAY